MRMVSVPVFVVVYMRVAVSVVGTYAVSRATVNAPTASWGRRGHEAFDEELQVILRKMAFMTQREIG